MRNGAPRDDSQFKNAFDYSSGTLGWGSDGGYNDADGSYNGTTNLGGLGYLGEWISLKIPAQKVLSGIQITPRDDHTMRCPKTFTILGTNDETNWSYFTRLQIY